MYIENPGILYLRSPGLGWITRPPRSPRQILFAGRMTAGPGQLVAVAQRAVRAVPQVLPNVLGSSVSEARGHDDLAGLADGHDSILGGIRGPLTSGLGRQVGIPLDVALKEANPFVHAPRLG